MNLVNEIFPSIQGEGMLQGMAVTFVRLAGCNMKCDFCDTKHDTGAQMAAEEIVKVVRDYGNKIVFLTGGEPLMQDTTQLVADFKKAGLFVGVETNGSRLIDLGKFDFVSISPKVSATNAFNNMTGINVNTLQNVSIKVLYPYIYDGAGKIIHAEAFKGFPAQWFGIQPIDKPGSTIDEALAEVMRLGAPWRLSLQLHKLIGVK